MESNVRQAWYSITSSKEIAPDLYLMWLEAPDIALPAQPGQFVTIRCGDFLLRRPFSIHLASSQQISLLFRVVGKGTLWLSQREKGDRLDVLGPLGNGFRLGAEARNLLLVGGGIGIAPLVFLMRRVSGRSNVVIIHGVNTAADLYLFSEGKRGGEDESLLLPQGAQFVPVTEDGSKGRKGKVSDILPEFLGWADQIYACGPLDMYKAMAQMSLAGDPNAFKLRKCQISLEVRMGCGFGACYGCTISTKRGLKQVCRDGPIFELDDIIWEEVKI